MAFFKKFTGGYDELWKAIIRPPRDTYDLSDLGPTEFYIGNKSYKRTDLQLTNSDSSRWYAIENKISCTYVSFKNDLRI